MNSTGFCIIFGVLDLLITIVSECYFNTRIIGSAFCLYYT